MSRAFRQVAYFASLIAMGAAPVAEVDPGPPARAAATATETLRVAGLEAPVEIRVDRWGVPHIYASGEADLFFAQGFNAARDRLFQIDLWRRRGLGLLAEAFGPEYVEQDRAARLFLYRGDMEREWGSYGVRGALGAEKISQRFVDGINAYIDWLAARPERMPWEFARFDYRPARWSAEDVVRIRSHGLTRNLLSEVARAGTLCRTKDVGADRIRRGLSDDWKAGIPEGLDPCLPVNVLEVFNLATREAPAARVKRVGRRGDVRRAEALVDGCEMGDGESGGDGGAGSNSWVVAPSRSATGRGITANDPHRAYSTPSLRYLVHLSAPGLDVIGAGEPAIPGVSLGHNGAAAFGITIFGIDQEDMYVYELNPADVSQYRYRDGWEPLRVVRETVPVKGEAPQEVELRFTRHGPVIHLDPGNKRAYAVRTVWLEPGTSPYFVSVESMRARSFDAFRGALTNWGVPALNQVYADATGDIGWAVGGLAPRRPNWDGLLPVPGDGRYEWEGFWRGDDLPQRYNPPEGWIATANAYNIPAGYPARERKLGFEWANPSRHQRIHEVLGSLPKISLEDSERLQNDVLSIPARRLAALLAPLTSNDEKTARALSLLRGWDARLEARSPQAALEELWQQRHLRKSFRNAVLGPEAALGGMETDVEVMLAALEGPGPYFGAGAAAKRDQLLLSSLRGAWGEMERLQGPDPASWEWGRLHFHLSEHPLAPMVDDATRAKIGLGPIPKQGSEHTPNASFVRESDFRQTLGPSVRLVIDVGEWDNTQAVNHPGQSGDPDSPHYRDLAPLWRDGRYFPLLYSRQAVERETERIIHLVPGSARRAH
jgi:penicillin amidase